MKKALGRGLSALIPDSYINKTQTQETPKSSQPAAYSAAVKQESAIEKNSLSQDTPQGFLMIPIDQIIPNQDQPRQEFAPEAIEELAASIKEKGILQPVLVKKMEANQYMLICGERRYRASLLCGLNQIPAIVKDVANQDLLEWALIENIQRQDLNPIEEAEAYRRLVEERLLSQEEVAKRVGKDRATVANTIRLLRLPEEVRRYVFSGQLTAGHARAILGMLTPEHQKQLARRIVEETLSVRQVEAIVNRSNAHKRKAKAARNLMPEIVDIESRLARHLGTQVKIYPKKNKTAGRIEIQYFSLDDFDRILEKLGFALSS